MSESHPAPPASEIIARGHEGTAVNPRYFVIALIAFLIFSVALTVMLFAIMRGMVKLDDKRDGAPSVWSGTARPVPPQPWLQPSIPQGDEPRQPWQDMVEFRQHESQILGSYGSVDPSTGTVRIPIDRAMQILAERDAQTSQPAGGTR